MESNVLLRLVVVQFEISWLAAGSEPCHTAIMPKKAQSKWRRTPKPAKALRSQRRRPKEDFNQAAFRAVQETIRRAES